MKTLCQKPSLLRACPELGRRACPLIFSPIYLNAENISTEKLLALYRFAHLFFPQLGPGLVKMLLDMEQNSERLTAGISSEERRKLIGEMQGLSMDIQYALKDGGQKMMEISIHIVPGDVLERARQGKVDPGQYRQLRADLEVWMVRLIEKEVRRRFTARVETVFRTLLQRRHVPSLIARLMSLGWIDRQGRLMPGATIDDLIAGKYRAQFARLAPEELLQEGMQIRETINACFAIDADDPDILIADAGWRHALLKITIAGMQPE